MAEFGGDGPKEDLGARGRVVKLDDLDREAPTLKPVSPAERAAELAAPPCGIPPPASRGDGLTWPAG